MAHTDLYHDALKWFRSYAHALETGGPLPGTVERLEYRRIADELLGPPRRPLDLAVDGQELLDAVAPPSKLAEIEALGRVAESLSAVKRDRRMEEYMAFARSANHLAETIATLRQVAIDNTTEIEAELKAAVAAMKIIRESHTT